MDLLLGTFVKKYINQFSYIELKDLEKAVFFCLSHKAISIPERKENEENDNKKSQSEGLQNTNENSNENENEIPLEILLDSVMSGISPEIFKFLKMICFIFYLLYGYF